MPSSKTELEKEIHIYLFKGAIWAGLVSVLILAAILFNIMIGESPVLALNIAILYMSPLLCTFVFAAVIMKMYSADEISNRVLLVYLVLLEASWLFLILMIFDSYNELFLGDAALSGVESLMDILVLTFAIALFPDRRVMLMGVLPFMLLSIVLRVNEIPDNYLFPLTKFVCFLAIIITGQKVLFTWFERAIVRDVEKQHLLKYFRQVALIDGLTNISNRRHFDEVLSQEIRAAERNKHPLSVILIDVDYFKKLNDSLGHQVGDECLIELAKVLMSIANRPRDLAARYGGEEFVILLPDTDLNGSQLIAGKLKLALSEARLIHPDSAVSDLVTVSQGVCLWQQGMRPEDLMGCADKLLYQAKSTGRDRFITS
ncbi:GGDEF domain-containing protein [Shewanella violacea]|uniref:diguanylate cyclase n=1 Tax=Shewanella violacea (strain JCM 10179 / CIP 106290 / LMG 19151 / DSS12) TaxID=637905 RepID=D4ZC06_SHEVD|nr:GGDEF domain-containing protein [Shewanella violacea]BAJ03551.1 GGDEF domain protein [Shewanella violacea DSS12]